MIYLITGKKQAGKDTMADFVIKYMNNKAFLREIVKIPLAKPMKDVAQYLFNWPDDLLSSDRKEEVDTRFGISPRQFLQVFGTDFMQFMLSDKFEQYKETTGRKFWAIHLADSIMKYDFKEDIILVPDVRFPHEVDYIKETFGNNNVKIIRIVRPSLESNDEHPSEKEMDQIKPDYIIVNDSTLFDYQLKVNQFIESMYFNNRIKVYISGPISGFNENNEDSFENAKKYLTDKGYLPISPIDLLQPGKYAWEIYMKEDIKALVDCDMVYMLRGWEHSVGASIEHSLAKDLSLPIMYEE